MHRRKEHSASVNGLSPLLAVLFFFFTLFFFHADQARCDEITDQDFFETRVEPILQKRCYTCHSHIAGEMKGGLTLDSRSGWQTGGESGPAIIPEHPEKSLLIEAIERTSLAMPPAEALPVAEIVILKDWIRRGAFDPRIEVKSKARPSATDWWAVKPLVRPGVPQRPSGDRISRNPIDAFLRDRLHKVGLGFSQPVDRRGLIRRVTFDLHGLPPTPEETESFVADTDSKAYENLVDRLLSSPRFGERFARLWLDVVHYGESNGFGMDRPRLNAWPYRDYVIRRFNDDVPYDRFVQEQIAADVMFPDQFELIPALGFLAAGPLNQSALAEQVDGTLCKKIALNLDRDDMLTNVATTFLSLTLHCARCHDHKFDPLSQDDYYRMQAVFAGVIRGERIYGPPELIRLHQIATSTAAIPSVPAALDAFQGETQNQLRNQASDIVHRVRKNERMWSHLVTSEVRLESNGPAPERLPDGSLRFATTAETDIYTIVGTTSKTSVASIRLEVLADESLPHRGPGLQPQNGNITLTEIKAFANSSENPDQQVELELQSPQADFQQEGWGIAKAIDRNSATGWGIHPAEGRSHQAVFSLKKPVSTTDRSTLTIRLEQLHGRQHTIGRLRISVSEEVPQQVAVYPPDLVDATQRIDANATQQIDESVDLFAILPGDVAATLLRMAAEEILKSQPPIRRVFAVGGDAAGLRNYQRPGKPYPIYRLARGDVTKPGPEMPPGGLTTMPVTFRMAEGKAPDDGVRREALARWLTDPGNPLLWRSIVNRIWTWHFGNGIVATPNDFGQMGSAPSHPELIDYLASELRESGGSLKQLHRRIVLSDAYQQDSKGIPRAAEIDGDNRLLWRMPRRRLEAEQIRDALLAASGRLDRAVGGPSAMQFYYDDPNVSVSPMVDYTKFDVDSPASRRRGIYRFIFRNVNDPFLEAFDSPDPSLSVAKRTSTITPLQALALYNNAFVLRQCEHIATRLNSVEIPLEEKLDRAFGLLYSRRITQEEIDTLKPFTLQHGLENTLRVLVNSNEFIFVR